MPELRGHHLICLHFFDGEGYSREFVTNLTKVLQEAGQSPVEICSGADDICAKCPYLKDHICQYGSNAEEDIRAMDAKALELLLLCPGDKTEWSSIGNALPGIFIEWYRSCCDGCDWITVCGKNALYQRLLADKP